MANNEKVQDVHQISIPEDGVSSKYRIYYLRRLQLFFCTLTGYVINKKPINNKLGIKLKGALIPKYYGNLSTDIMSVWVQLMLMKEVPINSLKIRQSDIVLLQVYFLHKSFVNI